MSTIHELHDKAKRLAQQAENARRDGDLESAKKFAQEAYHLAQEAAEQIPLDEASEPMRSTLYQSAASLAYQAQAYAAAARLVNRGLSGYPSSETEQALYSLLDKIRYEHGLYRSRAILKAATMELTLMGNAVQGGAVPYAEFGSRVGGIKTLIDQTVERLSQRRKLPFYDVLFSISNASDTGRFSVRLRLQYELLQRSAYASPDAVVTNILEGLRLLNDGNVSGLQQHIDSTPHYRSFLIAAKLVAPDGNKVSVVGLRSQQMTVAFGVNQSQIEIPPPERWQP